MTTQITTGVEYSLSGSVPEEAFEGPIPVTVRLSAFEYAGSSKVAQPLLATIDLRVPESQKSVRVSGHLDDGRTFAGRLHRDDLGRSFLNVTTVETVPRPNPA